MRSDGRVFFSGALKIGLLSSLLILARHHLISEYGRQDLRDEAAVFYSDKMTRFDPGRYQAFTLGFSLARGFNFKALGVSGLHMLDSGGSFLSALLKLKGLKRERAAPRVIFLPITETSLQLPVRLNEEDASKVATYLWNTPNSIPFWLNDPVFVLSSQMVEYTHTHYEIELLAKLLRLKPTERGASDSATSCTLEIAEKRRLNVPRDGDFVGYSDWHLSAPCWKWLLAMERERLRKRAEQGAGNVAENIRIIQEIAALSRDMNAQLVLVRMPVSGELVASLSDIAVLDEVEAAFLLDPNILYLNYEDFLSDTLDDRIFFRDPLHLNRLGSELFSTAMATELLDLGLRW